MEEREFWHVRFDAARPGGVVAFNGEYGFTLNFAWTVTNGIKDHEISK